MQENNAPNRLINRAKIMSQTVDDSIFTHGSYKDETSVRRLKTSLELVFSEEAIGHAL